MLNTALK